MKAPLGKNQIGKFLSTAAKNAGISQKAGAKVTNHSVRKTSVSRLLDEGVPENFVAQHSGHKNTDSLQSYKSAGEKQQKQMSMILSRVQNQSTRCYAIQPSSTAMEIVPSVATSNRAAITHTSSTSTATSSSFLSGVQTIQNCNFQVFNGDVSINVPVKRRRVMIESDDEA